MDGEERRGEVANEIDAGRRRREEEEEEEKVKRRI